MTREELARDYGDLYNDCVDNLNEPDKALLYLQKMRHEYHQLERRENYERFGSYKLKNGDHVLIVGAAEEEFHEQRVFVTTTDPWILGGHTEVVHMDSLDGEKHYAAFATKYLRVIPESYRRAPQPLKRWTYEELEDLDRIRMTLVVALKDQERVKHYSNVLNRAILDLGPVCGPTEADGVEAGE